MSQSFRRSVHLTVAVTQIIPRIPVTGRGKLPDIPPEVPESEVDAAAWQTAIRNLHQKESSAWAALRNRLAISGAKDFAGRLPLFAEAAECPPLPACAANLRPYGTSFAADDMENTSPPFPNASRS